MNGPRLSRQEYAKRLAGGNVHRIDTWASVEEAAEFSTLNRFYRFEAVHVLGSKLVALGQYDDHNRARKLANVLLYKELPGMEAMDMIRKVEPDLSKKIAYEILEAPAWDVARMAIKTLADLYPSQA